MHLIRMYDMKYKEKITYRTTASGGQEIITEQVPVYNKFEQFAKKQHDKRVNKLNSKGKPIKIPFIIRHPGICAFILGVFIILVVYLISSANSYMDELIKQYTTLTVKTNDSKYSFDKKLFYVTVEADGTKKITFGYKSEQQQEQAEQAAEEAANTGSTENTATGGTSITLSADAEQVKQLLEANGYSSKAGVMAYAYDYINPLLGTNAAIGLMANIANEGTLGLVEESFYSSIKNSMNLTGGKYNRVVTTKSDIEYLKSVGNSKSLGFGAVQWSFGRRVTLCNIYLNNLGSSTTVTQDIMMKSEAEMICNELSPGTDYYNKVSSKVGSDTAENWAEAFCDYYEKPGGWCGKGKQMSGTGSSCSTRRNSATSIANLLKGLGN